MRRSRELSILCLAIALACLATRASAYPLDGFAYTGIGRLEAQRLIQVGELPGAKRPAGELMPMPMVEPRLLDQRELAIPPADATLTARVVRLLGPHADRYGIALLDLSDRAHPRYAEWNGHQHQNPGSVGKLMVALAIFQALADIHPDDIAAREHLLRSTMIRADAFSVSDHHTVPFWDAETRSVSRRPIHPGDTASLWTYLDWMMSPSSNSAAGMLQKNLIAMAHFGRRYPAPPDEERRFFDETPKPELGAIFRRAIEEPITRNGLDLDELRQGSFFTHQGKSLVPGTSSHATPRALVEFTLKLEQGRLVDTWSSRELKQLMYVTERRIRYGSAGVLQPAALYFKSGSLYSCVPEEGFVCRKYHGNRRNYMNSVAIIESPAGQNRLFYSVAVLSNVLRKNSAEDHRALAQAIHDLLLADHPPKALAAGERAPATSYGEGFIGYEQERRAMQLRLDTQQALLALGYEIGEIDGVIGPNTRAAIRRFQSAAGEQGDAEVSEALLAKLRAAIESRGASRPAASPAP